LRVLLRKRDQLVLF